MGKPYIPPRLEGPCKNCPDRTTEPNCHDPERCEKWKTYLAQKQAFRDSRRGNPADSLRKEGKARSRAAYYRSQKKYG